MHPLVKLILQRVGLGLLLLFAASLLIFIGTSILPGDVAQMMLGRSATAESVANLRREMGLDQPLIQRYLQWLFGIIQGDFGVALTNGADIAQSIGGRLKNTLFLTSITASLAIPLAIGLGLLAVRYRNRWPDKLISAVTLSAISLPEFIIGYLVMFLFSIKLGLLPSSAMIHDGMSLVEKFEAIILPVIALLFVVLAHMMRMTRAAIINVMESDYIETAYLKGLKPIDIIFSHALPNAIAPIVNVVMLNLAYLIVGVVVIEVVFVYPGMGQYLVDHVAKRDIPVVQAAGLIFAAVYIVLNTLADLVSIISNPRLRHPK